MKEIWKDINNRYQVSNFGNVRSVDLKYKDNRGRERFKRGVLLTPGISSCGYPVVNISGFGHKKHWKIHKLVALFFLPNPNNLPVINHKNGIKTDNRVENLEWCTQQYNTQHAYDVLKRPTIINKGLNNGYSKQVKDIITGRVFECIQDASVFAGLKASTLAAMLRGQNPNKTNLRYVCSTTW